MNKFQITIIFIINFLCFNNLIAQGGVNVKSIKIDSLNLSYLNKEVKIDFKNTEKQIGDSSYSIESLWISHTKISIDNKLVYLKEYNGRGVDYWYFDKAYLELYNYKQDLIFRVSKSIVKELRVDSIKFQWTIESYSSKEISSLEIKDVWIPKESINSVIIKI